MFTNDFGYHIERQRRLDEMALADAARQAQQAVSVNSQPARTSTWMVLLGALLVAWGTRLQARGQFTRPAWVDPTPCP